MAYIILHIYIYKRGWFAIIHIKMMFAGEYPENRALEVIKIDFS